MSELRQWIPAERLITDPAELRVYECDALCRLAHTPAAVVLCAGREDVLGAVRWCLAAGTTFVPRGAGTGWRGGATPAPGGVVIDTSLMRRVLRWDAEDRYAVVEPGLPPLELSRSVEHHGLFFAPDLSRWNAGTLAGRVAENSGGPQGLKYGTVTDHVLGLEVVLPDGEIVRLGSPHAEPPSYDLTGLFVGTEGTTGVITEVTVRLLPRPQAARTYLAAFADSSLACRTALDITRHGIVPAALEILDPRAVQAVNAATGDEGHPSRAAFVLLVEIDGPEPSLEEEDSRIRRVVEANQALEIRSARDPEEREKLWKGLSCAFGALGRVRPDLDVLDVVVPRTRMEGMLRRVHDIAAEHGILLSTVVHAGSGNLHPTISYDGRDPREVTRALAAGREILQACADAGGSAGGALELGPEGVEPLQRMAAGEDLDFPEAVRRALDPRGMCIPGKLFTGSNPRSGSGPCVPAGESRKEIAP